MKLLLKMSGFENYDNKMVVDWDKGIDAFPKFAKYDNRFWGSVFYDRDRTGAADYFIVFSEHKETAMPFDMFGQPFPITDFELMFNVKPIPDKPCECGANSVGGGIHSSYCPLASKT